MNDSPSLPSDCQLVGATRCGNDAAWQELMARHESAIRRAVAGSSRTVRRSITVALDGLRGSLSGHPAEGEKSVRAFRPRAIAAVTDGAFGPASFDSGIDLVDDDGRLLASAFARLPEPWQTVLWHIHVERQTAAEVSPLVGRSVIAVTELLSTAERGLVDAYLAEYLRAADLADESREIVPLLGGYLRGALAPHEQRIVEVHLHDDLAQAGGEDGIRHHAAGDSRRLMEVARSLPETLPPAIAPGITGMSVEHHREALGTATRAFGSAAMSADRSDRFRRAIVIGSAVAVLLALIGVAFLVRPPFDDDSDGSPTTSSHEWHRGPFDRVDAYDVNGDS